MVETINKLRAHLSAQLLQELGREPTPEGDRRGDGHARGARCAEILKIAQEPVSLETPIGEEEDSHLGDFIRGRRRRRRRPTPPRFTLLQEQLEEACSTA